MTGRVCIGLLLAALMVTGCADDRSPVSGGPDRSSSRGADPETRGSRPGPGRAQTAMLAQLDGRTGGGCVDVAGGRDVRSGGFAAGPFDEARSAYRDAPGDARTVRLYFIPEHPQSMPGLTVTGRRARGHESFREVQKTSSTVEEFRFYDVDVTVPAAGRWQIRAQAGADSGCWSVRLG